jgi:hypothetical protein
MVSKQSKKRFAFVEVDGIFIDLGRGPSQMISLHIVGTLLFRISLEGNFNTFYLHKQ